MPHAQVLPEELAEARAVLMLACRSDEQAPPPPSLASSSPPSNGQLLLVQRALHPAAAAAGDRSSGPVGSLALANSGDGLGMRRAKSSVFSSTMTSASMNVWGGKGSGSGGAGGSLNEELPNSLLLSLMSVTSDVGDSAAAAVAAALACGYGPGSAATGEEDAEVQQSLLEMLMGRRAQAPVSDLFPHGGWGKDRRMLALRKLHYLCRQS